MKLDFILTACLLPATALAATRFETFNPLLRMKDKIQPRSQEQPQFTKRQTQSSPFVNANTTRTYVPESFGLCCGQPLIASLRIRRERHRYP